jgi:thiol-disulfide isomerase/thioredoxin
LVHLVALAIVLVLYFCVKTFVKPETLTIFQQYDVVYQDFDVVHDDDTLNNQRLMRTFYASVVVFVVFWAPWITFSRAASKAWDFFLKLASFKSLANPIAYIYVNSEFRALAKRIKFCRN